LLLIPFPFPYIMNILIIEDHPLIRVGLKMLINEVDPKASVTPCDNFPDGLELVKSNPFDMVILDIDIPGGEHIRMIDLIRSKRPDVSILVHSGYDETVYALPYMKAGASGFLSKQAQPEEVKTALATVMNNGQYLSEPVRKILANNLNSKNTEKSGGSFARLSPNEMQVMQLLTQGKWTKEIAAIMNIKENTVSTYKRRIFDKLEVMDAIELSKKVSLLKQL
jgi:two-component system invasion response regulator UvrY